MIIEEGDKMEIKTEITIVLPRKLVDALGITEDTLFETSGTNRQAPA